MSNDTAMVTVTAAYNVNFMVEVRATAREVITGVDEGVKRKARSWWEEGSAGIIDPFVSVIFRPHGKAHDLQVTNM